MMPLLPIVSCFIKIQSDSTFWCRLTQVVLEKGPLNRCSYCIIYWLFLRCYFNRKFSTVWVNGSRNELNSWLGACALYAACVCCLAVVCVGISVTMYVWSVCGDVMLLNTSQGSTQLGAYTSKIQWQVVITRHIISQNRSAGWPDEQLALSRQRLRRRGIGKCREAVWWMLAM